MLLLSARYVVCTPSSIIPDGAVVVNGNRIMAVGSKSELRGNFPNCENLDFPEGCLMPGLINAHTHLELSALRGKVGFEGEFTDWVRSLAHCRGEFAGNMKKVLTEACQESLRGGVTTVGDISTFHQAWKTLVDQPIRKVCFGETFGLTMGVDKAMRDVRQWVGETRTNDLLKLGLSPHAPYSAGTALYESVASLAREHELVMTTHLAETCDENEFLQTGQGAWKKYLSEIGKWDGSFRPPEQSAVRQFLDLNLSGQAVLLAHVNHISDDELVDLAKTSHSVAYCPRTHSFFGHRAHRFREMLECGINVCLGTDSLASNPDLSLLGELRFLHEKFGDLDPAILFQMATSNGAKALGWDDAIGSLLSGKQADMIAIPLKNADGDPLVDVLESRCMPRWVMVGGKVVVEPQ